MADLTGRMSRKRARIARKPINPAEFYALRDMRRAGVRPRDLALATGRRQNSVSRLTRRVEAPNSRNPDTVSSSLGVGLYPTSPILLPGKSVPLPAARPPQVQTRRRSFNLAHAGEVAPIGDVVTRQGTEYLPPSAHPRIQSGATALGPKC